MWSGYIMLAMVMSLPLVGYIGTKRIDSATKAALKSAVVDSLFKQGFSWDDQCTEYKMRSGEEIVVMCLSNGKGCIDTVVYNFSVRRSGGQPIRVQDCN